MINLKVCDKVAIQLNDCIRCWPSGNLCILVDPEKYLGQSGYNGEDRIYNHTTAGSPEVWRVKLLEQVLPHLQIIYEINLRFLESVTVV
jgi:hypothetical protein